MVKPLSTDRESLSCHQAAHQTTRSTSQDLRKFPFEPPSVGAYSYTPLPYVMSRGKSCSEAIPQKVTHLQLLAEATR